MGTLELKTGIGGQKRQSVRVPVALRRSILAATLVSRGAKTGEHVRALPHLLTCECDQDYSTRSWAR